MGHRSYKQALQVFWILLLAVIVQADFSSLRDHKVEVKDIFVPPRYLTCQKEIPVMVEVRNTGNHNENVFLELRNDRYDSSEVMQLVDLKKERVEIVAFTVTLLEIPQGDVEFEAVASYAKRTSRFFQTFTFSCEEKEPVTIIQGTPGMSAQEQKIPAKEYYYTLSALTIATFALVILIVTLAIVYIVKTYVEKQP